MIQDALPANIHLVPGSFRDPETGDEKTPDHIYTDPFTNQTIMEWNLSALFIENTWSVSFNITGSELGLWPANVFDISRINYTKWDNTSEGVLFPETWLEVITPPPLPPTPFVSVVNGGIDLHLKWTEPMSPNTQHYLIYRSESQRNFDFSTPWKDTSIDPNPISGMIEPLRREWMDRDVNDKDNVNYSKEYYYILRTVNVAEEISVTSRTVGKWTQEFFIGVNTFSLPLEPSEPITVDNLTTAMEADFIRWMNYTTQRWVQHDYGEIGDDSTAFVGQGYMVKFSSPANFTFTGMPGAMIRYDNSSFVGFNFSSNAKNLVATVNNNGDVTLNWERPEGMTVGVDRYLVYYSSSRDGFWGTLGVDYHILGGPILVGTETATHFGAATAGTQLYYIVRPELSIGEIGSSTYSIGVWTARYDQGYNTMGLPLKLGTTYSTDWYCDAIEDTWGMNYYNITGQRWMWHKSIMQEGIYDSDVVMCEGYQVSTISPTKFSFVGI
jgi:hypothetical protein